MRLLISLFCLGLQGCIGPAATGVNYRGAAQEPTKTLSEAPAATAVTDLRTRKTGTDWPSFLGPDGTSVSSEKGIIKPWPKQGLQLKWDYELGTGYGMPSISKGRLFLFDRHGSQARLTCLNSETGKFLWKFEYPTDYEDYFGYNNGPRCCPVVDADRVYTFGAEGMLHCVNVMDGKLLWRVNTKADFDVVQNFFGVGSTPVVEGDLLLVMVGGSPPNSGLAPTMAQRGNGTGVIAFDKRTGAVRYKATNELASYAGPVLSAIDGKRWCFLFARGGLVGLDPATGKTEFHFPWRARILESVNGSNPVVVGNQVFISECYGIGSALLQVKPGGYSVVWSDAEKRRNKSMMCHWMTPIHHEGYVYGSSGRHTDEAELRCMEWATGQVLWSQPDLTRASLLMIDGHFICLGENGEVRLLKVNPQKFDQVSTLEAVQTSGIGRSNVVPLGALLKPPCWAAPIVSHGLLYLRGNDRLLCLELIP